MVFGSGVAGIDAVPGQGSLAQSWSTLTTGPVLVSLDAPTPALRNIVVAGLTVTFARAIDPATFDWRDLSLTRSGTNVITSDGAVTIERSDFRLTGEGLDFNTKTRKGKLTGHIEMLIYDRNSNIN